MIKTAQPSEKDYSITIRNILDRLSGMQTGGENFEL